jgi:hypothetical protein
VTPILLLSPPAAFAAICIALTVWIGRSDRPGQPQPQPPVPIAVPAPFPSSAIPDCPAIAGRVTGAAWLEFLSAHDLEGTP